MNLVFNLFTKKEILIVGVVICSLLLIVLFLTVWDLISRKRRESKELDEIFNEYHNEIEKQYNISEEANLEPLEKEEVIVKIENEIPKVLEQDVKVLPVNEVANDVKEESNNQVLETIVKKEKKVEVETLIIDDEEIESESTLNKAKIELQKIEEELKNPKSLEDTLSSLEAIEEENAIISYQDLLEKTSELNVVDIDSGDEPISIKEVMSMYDNSSNFDESSYISSITEFENETATIAEIQLENTANLEKLDKEIRKTNKFLSILNDLKKNLE